MLFNISLFGSGMHLAGLDRAELQKDFCMKTRIFLDSEEDLLVGFKRGGFVKVSVRLP